MDTLNDFIPKLNQDAWNIELERIKFQADMEAARMKQIADMQARDAEKIFSVVVGDAAKLNWAGSVPRR